MEPDTSIVLIVLIFVLLGFIIIGIVLYSHNKDVSNKRKELRSKLIPGTVWESIPDDPNPFNRPKQIFSIIILDIKEEYVLYGFTTHNLTKFAYSTTIEHTLNCCKPLNEKIDMDSIDLSEYIIF